MPRAKKIPPSPRIIGSYFEGIQHVEIVEINEQTEYFGKGAKAKIRRLRNHNNALELFADEYFWGKNKRKLHPLIHNPRKISALANQLVMLGIDLEDRALRNLAALIRKDILALENAIKNNSHE